MQRQIIYILVFCASLWLVLRLLQKIWHRPALLQSDEVKADISLSRRMYPLGFIREFLRLIVANAPRQQGDSTGGAERVQFVLFLPESRERQGRIFLGVWTKIWAIPVRALLAIGSVRNHLGQRSSK
ncbi:hypothetical protein CQ059_12105 [Brucella pseudogrignonensis]|nr:hypothetical protein CQ059_12105 [Brucella pseudogrignonensis]PRA39790.1 hypothetical protein CQ063_16635 [Brucella pseudogrignonensis]PRA66223.1 hypothetical protein CQ055_16525 [Brucella pseudogrignonensis]